MIHQYKITWTGALARRNRVGPFWNPNPDETSVTLINAYSAADALTQFDVLIASEIFEPTHHSDKRTLIWWASVIKVEAY